MSILTEIDRIKHKNNIQPINEYDYNTLKKATLTGTFNKRDNNKIMNMLLGNTINKNITKTIKGNITKIMHSHLHLLSNINIDKKKQIETDYIRIINKQTNRNHKLNKDDINKGKIVVRELINDTVQIKNIRYLLENLSMTDLEQYNVGLGSASTRTKTQKKLAQKYTVTVINAINTWIIFSDGSINNKVKNGGGFGGLLLNNAKRTLKKWHSTIGTEDAQMTEIAGINYALKILIKKAANSWNKNKQSDSRRKNKNKQSDSRRKRKRSFAIEDGTSSNKKAKLNNKLPRNRSPLGNQNRSNPIFDE